ncbi:MAG: hypothetical protein NZO58_03395 [Gemmataceae bacterium]|nr:hypothetical protein [Gemmataceae bacterium]
MAPEPFLTVPLRRSRDWLHARFRARQVAQLLSFTEYDAACIAALSFLLARQATLAHGRADLCFAIHDRRLHVYVRGPTDETLAPISHFRLEKELPHDERRLPGEDVAWLIRQLQQLAPFRVLDEIVRQNDEVLHLLKSTLRSQETRTEANPTAA